MSRSKRPVVNEAMCFICQEYPPTWILTKGNREEFKLCEHCKTLVKNNNDANNSIRKAIYANDHRHIFQQVLGFSPVLNVMRFTKIEDKDA